MLEAESGQMRLDQLGSELAVGRLDGDELGAGETLGCTALVNVDVRAGRTDDRVLGAHDRSKRHDVGARAVEDVVDVALLAKQLAKSSSARAVYGSYP